MFQGLNLFNQRNERNEKNQINQKGISPARGGQGFRILDCGIEKEKCHSEFISESQYFKPEKPEKREKPNKPERHFARQKERRIRDCGIKRLI